jgi:hypothetical protein
MDFGAPRSLPIHDQPVGNSQQVGPRLPFLGVLLPRLPGPTKYFLQQIVGHVGSANQRQQEASNGRSMPSDPVLETLDGIRRVHHVPMLVATGD